jgi:hypothetical protein
VDLVVLTVVVGETVAVTEVVVVSVLVTVVGADVVVTVSVLVGADEVSVTVVLGSVSVTVLVSLVVVALVVHETVVNHFTDASPLLGASQSSLPRTVDVLTSSSARTVDVLSELSVSSASPPAMTIALPVRTTAILLILFSPIPFSIWRPPQSGPLSGVRLRPPLYCLLIAQATC